MGEKTNLNQVCTTPSLLWLASHWVAVLCVHIYIYIYIHILGGHPLLGKVSQTWVSFAHPWYAEGHRGAQGRRQEKKGLKDASTLKSVDDRCVSLDLCKTPQPGGVTARRSVPSQCWRSRLIRAVLALPTNLHLQHLSCAVIRGTKQPFADSPETDTCPVPCLYPNPHAWPLFLPPHRKIINPARAYFQWLGIRTGVLGAYEACPFSAYDQQWFEFNNASPQDNSKLIRFSHL